MTTIPGARMRYTAASEANRRHASFTKWLLWVALLSALGLALVAGAAAPEATARTVASGDQWTTSPNSSAPAQRTTAERRRAARRKAARLRRAAKLRTRLKACAGRKGWKLRRCRALVRCKQHKGKKRKRCIARVRKLDKAQKKKTAPTVQAQPPFQPQGNFQFIRQAPPPISCGSAVPFDKKNFPAQPKIDNTWLPIVPGTRYVLEGRANRGGGALPHQVTFTITDLTKVVNGVNTVVVWDVDKNEGEVREAELAFFAQDNDGNVWSLGEYPEEYDGGVFTGAPNTWIHGRGDGQGGIHMLANPAVGGDWYLQGSIPSIEFLDCGKVMSIGETTCVPIYCYKNSLVTHETSPLDPQGGFQTKHHAKGIGIVQVGAIDDPEGETLVMIKRWKLSAAGLARAREEALKLDRRGYKNSEVYRQTRRAK
jgi:hypothetical protein